MKEAVSELKPTRGCILPVPRFKQRKVVRPSCIIHIFVKQRFRYSGELFQDETLDVVPTRVQGHDGVPLNCVAVPSANQSSGESPSSPCPFLWLAYRAFYVFRKYRTGRLISTLVEMTREG